MRGQTELVPLVYLFIIGAEKKSSASRERAQKFVCHDEGLVY